MLLAKHEMKVLIETAKGAYSQNSAICEYHNWKHAKRVIKQVKKLAKKRMDKEFDTTPLILAAAWHDAVYVPGATDNEEKSAAAFANAFDTFIVGVNGTPGWMEDVKNRVCLLIRGTTIDQHLEDRDIDNGELLSTEHCILLDADLRALAYPLPKFLRTQAKIIRENRGDPSKSESVFKCYTFLCKFLRTREFIYRTYEAQAMWEARARTNIDALGSINSITAWLENDTKMKQENAKLKTVAKF